MEEKETTNKNDSVFTEEERTNIIDSYMRGERYSRKYSVPLMGKRTLNFELTMPFVADWREGENIIKESNNPTHDDNIYLVSMYVSEYLDKDFKKDGKLEYTEDAVKVRMDHLSHRLIDTVLYKILFHISELNVEYKKIFNVENIKNF